jgi:hypothetical protein
LTTAKLKILGTIALLVLIAVLLVAGTAYGGWSLWQSVQPEPTATAPPTFAPTTAQTPAPTTPATATHTDMPTPTPTVVPTASATATDTDTPTPTPTHTPTPTPTYTSAPAVATGTPIPTAIPKSPTPTPTVTYAAPTLLEPADGAGLSGTHRFTWQWNGPPLAGNRAFDLRIWSKQEEQNGSPRRGAIAPTQDMHAYVDLPYVPAITDYGSGDYYWTVVVVELGADGPPKVVGEWGEKRRFVYSGPRPPVASPRPTPTRIQP